MSIWDLFSVDINNGVTQSLVAAVIGFFFSHIIKIENQKVKIFAKVCLFIAFAVFINAVLNVLYYSERHNKNTPVVEKYRTGENGEATEDKNRENKKQEESKLTQSLIKYFDQQFEKIFIQIRDEKVKPELPLPQKPAGQDQVPKDRPNNLQDNIGPSSESDKNISKIENLETGGMAKGKIKPLFGNGSHFSIPKH